MVSCLWSCCGLAAAGSEAAEAAGEAEASATGGALSFASVVPRQHTSACLMLLSLSASM
jgi:hypothetical protein